MLFVCKFTIINLFQKLIHLNICTSQIHWKESTFALLELFFESKLHLGESYLRILEF